MMTTSLTATTPAQQSIETTSCLTFKCNRLTAGVKRQFNLCGATNIAPVLNDVSIEVLPGEIVAIVGPSGSGKSSLLKHAVGIFSPKRTIVSGACGWYNSTAAASSPLTGTALHQAVKFIPFDTLADVNLSVEEALTTQIKRRNIPNVKATVDALLQLTGLSKCRHNRIGSLEDSEISTGQRKSAALAMELSDDCRGLVLDEPTSGMDSVAATRFLATLRQFAKGHAFASQTLRETNMSTAHAETSALAPTRTILLTIHQPTQRMLKYLDRIYVLAGGRLIFGGSPVEAERYLEHDNAQRLLARRWEAQALLKHSDMLGQLTSLERLLYCALEQQRERNSEWRVSAEEPTKSICHNDDPVCQTNPAQFETDSAQVEADLSRKKKVGIFREFCLTFGEEMKLRRREHGALLLFAVVLSIIAVIMSSVYWRILKGVEFEVLPKRFEIPNGDIAMTYATIPNSPDRVSVQKESRSLEATDVGEMLPRMFRDFVAGSRWGLDGAGLRPWELFWNDTASSGRRVASSFDISQMRKITDSFGVSANEIWLRLGLAEVYKMNSLKDDERSHNETGTFDSSAVTSVDNLLKAWQLFDYVLKRDYTATKNCFQPNQSITPLTAFLGIASGNLDLGIATIDTFRLPDIMRVLEVLRINLPLYIPGMVLTNTCSNTSAWEPNFDIVTAPVRPEWEAVLHVPAMVKNKIVRQSAPAPIAAVKSRLRHSVGRRLVSRVHSVKEAFPYQDDPATWLAEILTPAVSDRSEVVGLWRRILNLLSEYGARMARECSTSMCRGAKYLLPLAQSVIGDGMRNLWTLLDLSTFLFLLTAFCGTWGYEAAMSFPPAKRRLNYQAFNQNQRPAVFMLARLGVDALFQLVPIFLVCTVIYLCADLGRGSHYWRFVAVCCLVTFAATGLSTAIAVIVSSPGIVVMVTSVCFCILVLLSGFVLRNKLSHNWFHVVSAPSMFRFGYIALMKNQFDVQSPQNLPGIFSTEVAMDIMGGVRTADVSYTKAVLILLAQGLVTRLIALVSVPFAHTTYGLKNA